jgi:hypothetical protein
MIAGSALVLDAFPDDPNQWLPETNLPTKPSLVSPTSPGIIDTLKPILKVGPFSDPNGIAHFMSHWQLSTSEADVDFEGNMVFDIESETSLISLQIPDLILESNQTYYWRVRFINQNQYASPWSEINSFSTPEDSNDTDGEGIEEEFKITAPVDLDLNDVDDNLQTDIKSVKTSVGDARVGIKIAGGVIALEQVKPIDPAELPLEGKPLNLPYGLVSFRLIVPPGAAAEVYVYFSKSLPPGMKWYKYDPAGGWYDFSSNAVFNDTLTSVALKLTDGGVGDADGVANGVIVDPSGPAGDAIWGGRSGGGSCFISAAADKPVQDPPAIFGFLAFSLAAFWGWTFYRKRN